MDNWNRTVEVDFIPKNRDGFTIKDLKVEFDIDKSTNVEPNKCFLKIYGMGSKHRDAMEFRWNTANDKYGGEIRIRAGYNGENRQIFRGAIVQAINKHPGPEWVTEVEAMTLLREILEAKVSRQTPYKAGTKKFQIFKDLINDVGVATTAKSLNAIEEKFGGATIKKSITLYGSAAEALNRLSNDLQDFINVRFHDDGVELLRVWEAINPNTPVILSPKKGLLGIPEVTIEGLNCKCLLRHDVQVGTLIHVQSDTVAALKTSGKYVTKRLQLKGCNREGDYSLSIQSVFPKGETYSRTLK